MATVLIVEDEAVIALDLASELKGLGLDILGLAKSYEQAMDIAARMMPDVAIVDIMLNGASEGARIARELRARGVRVLLTSGGDRSPEYGDMVFLAKPWQREELMRALGTLADAAD